MITDSSGLQEILTSLAHLSEELGRVRESERRAVLLKQMRLLLWDADEMIGSEVGDN